jgi:hypothetical protein
MKFIIKNIRILRRLRELRGENLFRQVLLRCGSLKILKFEIRFAY